MPRPVTIPDSPFNAAVVFMLEKHGPRPEPKTLRMQWDEWLAFATDAIAYDRERRKEKP